MKRPLLFLVLAGCGSELVACDRKKKEPAPVSRTPPPVPAGPASYVGRDACKKCHEDIEQSYAWSQHDLALAEPNQETLLADFDGHEERGKHLTAQFEMRKAGPVVVSGEEYPVKYLIGAATVQQYVIDVNGRLQVFGFAYDTRKKSEGGQKWLHLQDTPSTSTAHFTAPAQNFELECVECHTTGASVTYQVDQNAGKAQFATEDVSCEACHGPASRHVTLAEKYGETWPSSVENRGFDRALAPYRLRRWITSPGEKVARLRGEGHRPPEPTEEGTSCAPCHALRIPLARFRTEPPGDFNDDYLLHLILAPAYGPRGTARTGAYSYGSYLQSAHARHQVVCSDCHNPHSTTLRKPVVELCVTCHDASYQTKEHHFHPDSVDSIPTCPDCHMPRRTEMLVDERSDHAFSIPRPDLSSKDEEGDACSSCHPGAPEGWAARAIEKAHGKTRLTSFAPAFIASDSGRADACELLSGVFADESTSDIIRASALVRWAERGRTMKELDDAVRSALSSKAPLLRRAAAEASHAISKKTYDGLASRLLQDPLRSVRFAAATAYLRRNDVLQAPQGWEVASRELLETTSNLAHRPEFRTLLGRALFRLGKTREALGHLEAVLRVWPTYGPAWELRIFVLSEAKKEEQVQEEVLAALKSVPESAALNLRRGRFLTKREELRQALPFLRRAFEGAPGSLRREAGYVYGVTLDATGDWAEALAVLRLVKNEYPEAKEVLAAMDVIEERRAGKK